MTNKIKLTEGAVAKATRTSTKNGPVTFTFEGWPGLSLRVAPTKTSWQLRKREPDTGRLVALTLGSFPVMDHNAVKIAATEATAQIEQTGRHIAPDKRVGMPTFGEAFERYCEGQRAVGKIKDKTLADYRRQVFGSADRKGNLHKFVDRPLDTITRTDLQSLFDSGRPFKDDEGHTSTAWACRRIFAMVFGDSDEVETIPTAKLKMTPPRKRKSSEELGLTPADKPDIGKLEDLWTDIESLIDNPRKNPSLPNLWFFGLFTGIRMTALLNLTWDRVDLDGKTVHLRAADQKNKVARTLPLSDAAVDVLLTQREVTAEMADKTSLVFPSSREGKDGWRIAQVRRLDNGIFNSCRHHFSTAGAAAGLSDYAWGYLRGDVLHAGNSGNARMASVYMHDAGVTHDMANRVAAVILQRVGKDDDRHALEPAPGTVWQPRVVA